MLFQSSQRLNWASAQVFLLYSLCVAHEDSTRLAHSEVKESKVMKALPPVYRLLLKMVTFA